MIEFIKIFLFLLGFFVVGAASLAGIVFIAEWIAGSMEGVLFAVVFTLLLLLAIAAVLSIACR